MSKPNKRAIENRILPLAVLTPHARNYNRHGDAQIADLRESLRQFGQVRSVVVQADKTGKRYTIVAGHGIAQAAQAEGYTELRADVIPHSWSETRVLAYLAADNELGKHADPDADQLAAIVREVMEAEGEALARLAAGEQAALDAILNAANATNDAEQTNADELIDRAEELQKKWQCVKGDIWTAAGHYWICGDSRDFETWQKLLRAANVEKVNGVFTSPPYAEQRKKQYGGIATDKYVEWWNELQANVRAHLANDGSFFVNIKPHCENGERVLYVFDLVLAMQRQWGWKYVDEFCWRDTSNGVPGKFPNRFKDAFEPVYNFALSNEFKFRPDAVREKYDAPMKQNFHSSVGGPSQNQNSKIVSDRLPSNVIETSTEKGNSIHGAPFPIALPEFFIKAYSDIGDTWLDPFLGSGTTIVAAHKNNRRGLGIEFLEKYCAVICERIQKETGETPRRITQNSERTQSKTDQKQTRAKSRVARQSATVQNA